MGLSLVLVAVLAIGGTFAYLTDTDETVNVMTLGNVEIEQHEYERVQDENGNPVKGVEGTDFTADYGITESYKLKEFTQAKPAYPAVYQNGGMGWDEFQQLWNGVGAPGSNELFDDSMKNVIDKFVFVENTGKSDAYYRTIIAIEEPEGLGGDYVHLNFNANTRFDYNDGENGNQSSSSAETFYVTVDGTRYLVYTATYTEKLAPNEVSRPSLLQVYLDPMADNDDCALFGENWEIITLSQAVQVEGFTDADTALDTAFGDVTPNTVAEWFGDITIPVVAETAEDLEDALAAGEDVVLTAGVDYGTVTVEELKDVTITGTEGATMIFKTNADTKIENVTLKDVELEYTGATADCGIVIDANAQIDNLVIEDCTITGTGAKAGRGLSGYNNDATIVVKNTTFKDIGYPIYAWGGFESLTIEGCTFENIKSWAVMPQSGFDGDLTVNNCTFKDCLGGGLVKAGTLTAGHTFTFTNNTITGCTIAGDHNWFQFNVSAGTAVIANNTMDGAAWTPGTAEGLKLS